jgi:endonuclease/exonuclease/phosphatase (EEP) superfamily protein YafD
MILILLLASSLNSVIAPKNFPFFNLLSLSFPVLMIVNVIVCIVWILLWRKRALFFLGLSFLLFNQTQRWINWKPKSTEIPNLKIVTLNLKTAIMGREKIYEYLKDTDADIILAQENGSEFNVPGYIHRTNEGSIVALNSKTEILKEEKIEPVAKGNAFYADIKFEGKVIRIVNVYLNPFSFQKQKVKPTGDFETNKTKAMYILKKLIPTFKIHQQEIAAIHTVIDNSPYPVIVTGDFNSVPNSYEYYELGKGLTDAFVATGRGSSTSFHDYKLPIRIDYIFTSKEIKPVQYRVDRSVQLSDHYPVIAEFKVN